MDEISDRILIKVRRGGGFPKCLKYTKQHEVVPEIELYLNHHATLFEEFNVYLILIYLTEPIFHNS